MKSLEELELRAEAMRNNPVDLTDDGEQRWNEFRGISINQEEKVVTIESDSDTNRGGTVLKRSG